MPELEHQHEQHLVLDAIDDATGADSDAMEVLRAREPRRSDRAWFVGERRYLGHKPFADLGVELSQRTIRRGCKLDSVRRHGLEPEFFLDVAPGHAVFSGLKERETSGGDVGLIFIALN